MNRLTPSDRERILALASELDLEAERLEMEHAAKRDIIVTTPASARVKERGEIAGHLARSIRRRIQQLLASLYQ